MERGPQSLERRDFKHEEVAQLFRPLRRITELARQEIEAGTYEILIGDDASGRISTLALDRFLHERYRARGYRLKPTRFVAGSGSGMSTISGEEAEVKRQLLDNFARNLHVSDGRRALIVTDAIVSGKSLEPLFRALHAQDIQFDIAVVGLDETSAARHIRRDIEGRYQARIFIGGSNDLLQIVRRHDLAGVHKKKTELHARSRREEGVVPHDELQQAVNTTREDVRVLADMLTQAYEAEDASW